MFWSLGNSLMYDRKRACVDEKERIIIVSHIVRGTAWEREGVYLPEGESVNWYEGENDEFRFKWIIQINQTRYL